MSEQSKAVGCLHPSTARRWSPASGMWCALCKQPVVSEQTKALSRGRHRRLCPATLYEDGVCNCIVRIRELEAEAERLRKVMVDVAQDLLGAGDEDRAGLLFAGAGYGPLENNG